jgi:hypothetical protein
MAKRKAPPPPKASVADPMTEVEDDDADESPGISDDVVWLKEQRRDGDDKKQQPN